MSSEKSLDRALQHAIEASEPFRSWFLAQLRHGREYRKLVLCFADWRWAKVRLILPNPDTGALEAVYREGETDVLAVFENPSGERLGVHIENKLGGGRFTAYQPEVYAARAEKWMKNEKYGSYDCWETVLLAPAAFIEKNAEASKKFTTRITHEQLAAMVPAFGGDRNA